MDQYSVISLILSKVDLSDLIACFQVNRLWNILVLERLNRLSNWTKTDLQYHRFFKLSKQIPLSQTKKLGQSFCWKRGIEFSLYVNLKTGNKFLRCKTLNHFSDTHLTLPKCTLINLTYITIPPIFSTNQKTLYFIKFKLRNKKTHRKSFYFLDCTNLNDIKFYKRKHDYKPPETIAWCFFELNRPNIESLNDSITTSFNLTSYITTIHESNLDPNLFHLVSYCLGWRTHQLLAFSGSQVLENYEISLYGDLLNKIDDIVCGTEYFVAIYQDENDHTLEIINFHTPHRSTYSFWYDEDSDSELCPLNNHTFLILFQNLSKCFYKVFDIHQMKEVSQGVLQLWTSNHKILFRNKSFIDAKNSKIFYLNHRREETVLDFSSLW